MKKIIVSMFICLAFQGCNDGDIIVTNFDFDDAALQVCGESGNFVFFKLNDGVNESISLVLPTTEDLFFVSGTQSFTLGSSGNQVSYRNFDNEITENYFCNPIPPTSPLVTVEYLGTSGIARLISETTLDDNDGIDFVDSESLTEEGFGDFDLDEIPNYYDFDDDGDNVPTSAEIGDNPDEPRDSDGDGMYDYLDRDDDNDGILTINEDINQNLNPADDIGEAGALPNYLDPLKTDAVIIDAYRPHSYSRISDGTIVIDNLVLVNDQEEIIFESFNFGNITGVRNDAVTETPDF